MNSISIIATYLCCGLATMPSCNHPIPQNPKRYIIFSLFFLNLYYLIHGLSTSNIDKDGRRFGKYKETFIRRSGKVCLELLYIFEPFRTNKKKNNLCDFHFCMLLILHIFCLQCYIISRENNHTVTECSLLHS